MSWVSVSFDIGILRRVGAALFAATTAAPPGPFSRRGRIPKRLAPGMATLPLHDVSQFVARKCQSGSFTSRAFLPAFLC
jgi:hypothetical protein